MSPHRLVLVSLKLCARCGVYPLPDYWSVMNGDLYDEFGNYIGPEIESDDTGGEESQETRSGNVYLLFFPSKWK